MSNYDSILKEEKKYEEEKKEIKKFPWFKLDMIFIILLLIVGYIIYYNTILSPENIFKNNLLSVINNYKIIIDNLNLENNISGNISLNDKEYTFNLENNNYTRFDLNNKELEYYANDNKRYLKLKNFNNNYYELEGIDYLNTYYHLKEYLLNNLSKDKFIKKFYLNDATPIVEVNLVLKNEEIQNNLKLNSNNSYEVIFTFKNNAITNEIINMKITINNLTTNSRKLLLYENETLEYKSDEETLKFKLEKKNEDFTLKVSKNDILYSVLNGVKKDNSYTYTYQIIDKIYNTTLDISDNYLYEIISKIEKDGIINDLYMKISYQKSDKSENTYIDNSIKYNSLSDEEKDNYQLSLDNIIGELREFINKHK